METHTKIAAPRPSTEDRQPARVVIRLAVAPAVKNTKVLLRGAYLAFLSLFAYLFCAAPAVYYPVGLAPGT
jgi:hypothetical protein